MSSTPAYVITPPSGAGPGVLVLHSWFGLTPAVKGFCNDLADAGFVAIAPDLFDGDVIYDPDDAEARLLGFDANLLAIGVQSTASVLRNMPATPDAPIAVVGFSMGASLGLWLSERESDLVGASVSYYGSQDIDFVQTQASYLFHMADHDDFVDVDSLALMEASLHLAGRPVEFHNYADTGHWFAEPNSPGFDDEAAALAFRRTVEFLHTHLADS